MNLLKDPWIPIQRQSGKQELIIPSAITEQYDSDPIAFLAAPRPDFNGSLMQFLIGLLQTAFAPEFRELERSQWRKWYVNPPNKSELEEWFAPLISAFEFDGDGARFMQDKNLPKEKTKKEQNKAMNSLLLEDYSGHFIKYGFIEDNHSFAMCRSCAAIALFNLQISTPGIGSGHQSSLRGTCPLTTLIVEWHANISTVKLWRNLWLNVLPTNEIIENDIDEHGQLKDIFPWYDLMSIQSKECKIISSSQVHKMQMYWGMPDRIWFDFGNLKYGCCDLCGRSNELLIEKYLCKGKGINYSKYTFQHSLSPYKYRKEQKNKDPEKNLPAGYYPIKIKDGFVGYKHWASISLGSGNSKARDTIGCSKPAKIIHDRYLTNSNNGIDNSKLAIWAFGYDNSKQNAKFSCFYESLLPFYELDKNLLENFTLETNELIKMANEVLEKIRISIEIAWGFKKSPSQKKFRKEKEIQKVSNKTAIEGTAVLFDLNKKFWTDTENYFYALLEKLKFLLATENWVDEIIKLKQEWFEKLRKKSFKLFSDYGKSIEDISQIGWAHKDLTNMLNNLKEDFGLSTNSQT